MPELPEVETVLRGLQKHVVGRTLASVRVLRPLVVKDNPSVFAERLQNQTIESASRHGKALFLKLGSGGYLRVHLGMTGQMLVAHNDFVPDSYVRVLFHFSDKGPILAYRDVRQFGKMQLVNAGRESGWGPDAWTGHADDIIGALKKRKGMIKHALLNQKIIAGVGNIYADESLFDAFIHPKSKIESISSSKLKELCSSISRILGKSIEVGGTSFRDYVDTTGRRGGFKDWLHVYGKQGSSCPRCRSAIRKIVVASRGTHFCPRCQKPPRNNHHETRHRSLTANFKNQPGRSQAVLPVHSRISTRAKRSHRRSA